MTSSSANSIDKIRTLDLQRALLRATHPIVEGMMGFNLLKYQFLMPVSLSAGNQRRW
ncbi:hypothetical protein [Cedecea neteri]|uniref:hypothetical protein n=1 Tax=Cedecea neteri TaxID=158822 RepID=UPI00289A345A|nr:hypothetical protein [Cedecea neteri]